MAEAATNIDPPVSTTDPAEEDVTVDAAAADSDTIEAEAEELEEINEVADDEATENVTQATTGEK